ncbi:MAG: peptidyl-prolyl cis-trans isomerase [Planctomycetes bacterium]|nr:peptidyl-prolyl cis-trans isomerase [Planctomycetota bacterium]
MASQRAERIASGQVVANSSPAVGRIRASTPVPISPPIVSQPGDIRADILMVNDSIITVAEVLYPLRDELIEARRRQTEAGFAEFARRSININTWQQVRLLLIYQKTMGNLEERQREQVEKMVQHELDGVVSREFGDSIARFGAHLEWFGLTIEQYREALQRDLVSRQYLTERMRPRIQIRRAELLAHYRERIEDYSTPATRELMMIEAPFERFLPAGVAWADAGQSIRDRAKLAAVRHIRAASAALQVSSFEQAARKFSRGLHAEQGGNWGPIGRPLQPPFDKTSGLIFEYEAGQTSDPIETESGWYIVRCGKIVAANESSFEQVQDEIRTELEAQRFNALAAEYILELASQATISSLEAFVSVAVERAAVLQPETPLAAEVSSR